MYVEKRGNPAPARDRSRVLPAIAEAALRHTVSNMAQRLIGEKAKRYDGILTT
jgi:hypothetical protein